MALVLAGPASFCSGVAFPSLAQAFVPDGTRRAASAAPFYALNLIGGAIGVAAGGVLLPFWLGLEKTFYIAATLQITGGLLASRISSPTHVSPPASHRWSATGWPLLAASGLLSLATQSLLFTWARQVLEGSIYAMSAVLMVFIGGLGFGALAAGWLRKRGHGTRGLIATFGCASTLLLITLCYLGSSLSELILLLQEKSIGDWDFVWSKRHTKWVRLSLLPEFQPDHIKGLRETLSEKLGRSINEVFFRRLFARASFDGSILIHDNKKLYRGRSMEMGAGGLSVQLAAEEAVLKVGDHVHLHVKPSAETPAFNSACEVMSVRSLSTGDANSPVVFGMKFIGLEDNVRTELDGWATRKKNGAAA